VRFARAAARGAWRGVLVFLKLLAIVGPVYTLITVLRYTPAIKAFADFAAPFMKYFGLPGEAALALILGNVVNLYAGLGAITALKLPHNQLTVLALMLLISHSQILETAVFYQMKAKWWLLWFIRLAVALLWGAGLSRVLVPGFAAGAVNPEAAARLAQMARMQFTGLWPAARGWAVGLLDTGSKMLAVLVAIFLLLELAREYGLLEKILRGVNRVTRFIGLNREAGMPWLAGNVFGIVFGAGVITDSVRQGQLSPKQVTLVATFLALNHAVFEDTAIFLVLGASILWITLPRIVMAVAVTWVLSRMLKEPRSSGPAVERSSEGQGETKRERRA
jgi:hypothetical protein